MNTHAYDGSWAGFLSVVFEAYRRREMPGRIACGTAEQRGLFGGTVKIETEHDKADRVLRALEARLGDAAVRRLYRVFLSEEPGVEVVVFQLIQACIERGRGVLEDYRFGPAWRVERLAQQVGREVHRMHAFVRFERRVADRYVAEVAPDFNVLPLLGEHFAARYPAQRWAIADVRRGYALAYDPEARAVAFVPAAAVLAPHADDEAAFQTLWRAYYRAVTIPERASPALHLRHVPRRYWPYLTEQRTLEGRP